MIALNKSDLATFSAARVNDSACAQEPSAVVFVSAKTEAGLESLRAAILAPFANGNAEAEGLLITNARHHDLLLRAVESLASSEDLLDTGAGEELVLIGLHNALRYLGEITGETTPDEILGKIFSTFCIGK